MCQNHIEQHLDFLLQGQVRDGGGSAWHPGGVTRSMGHRVLEICSGMLIGGHPRPNLVDILLALDLASATRLFWKMRRKQRFKAITDTRNSGPFGRDFSPTRVQYVPYVVT